MRVLLAIWAGKLTATALRLLGRAGIGPGPLPGFAAPYVAAQGGALGRAGHVTVTADHQDIWVGGAVTHTIQGIVEI